MTEHDKLNSVKQDDLENVLEGGLPATKAKVAPRKPDISEILEASQFYEKDIVDVADVDDSQSPLENDQDALCK